MQSRVNDKCCTIDGHSAVNNFAMMVDQQQVADAHVSKAQAKWVDPKVVSQFGVAHGDVAGNAFTKTHTTENTQGAGEARLAIDALFFKGVECWHR